MATATLPKKLTNGDLLTKAGKNVTPNNVTFDQRQFDGTPAYAQKPVESIEAYERAIREDYEYTERSEKYDGFTRDEISVALAEVMNSFTAGHSKITKRGPMDRPSTRTVETGIDVLTGRRSTAVVADGAQSIPGFLGDNPYIEVQVDPRGTPFLHAVCVRRDQGLLEGIFAYVREVANARSIYLGQAIDTSFKFLDFSDFDMSKVAFTAKAQAALELFVIGPLRYSDANDKLGIEPKSAILFEGPPGGGKTMLVSTAIKTALLENVTVIVVDPSHGLAGFMRANAIANRIMSAGHKVMIVMEDMEKLAEQDRAAILEALDGADAKDARRIIIGTTNFIEQMDRAMIREGRFNDVVHCGLPDRQAFEQMLRIALVRNIDGKEVSFIGDHVDFDAAWCEINPDGTEVPHFQGFSFAFISGAVQNILRSYVVRNKGNISNLKVSTEDLIVAADGKREHFALMGMEPPPQPKQLDDLLDAMFRAAVSEEQSDLTDYSEINSRTWDTVKDLIDDTRVNLETESGKPITGVLDQRS